MIFDLSQTDFSKNEKNLSVLGSKERKKFTDAVENIFYLR